MGVTKKDTKEKITQLRRLDSNTECIKEGIRNLEKYIDDSLNRNILVTAISQAINGKDFTNLKKTLNLKRFRGKRIG